MVQADRRFVTWIIILATVAALVVRYWFVLNASVDTPVRGDAREYVAYAVNLVRFHVFSGATGAMPVSPDSYRDPGYPAFLVPWVAWIPDAMLRYRLVAYAQATLGALTVSAYLFMARHWISSRWLIAAAILLALWPHSITMPAYLLSETLVGFIVAMGLAFLVEGFATRKTRWLLGGALLFGCAGLTNAVLAPFIPVTAALGWLAQARMRRELTVICLVSLILPACWTIRNLSLTQGPTSSARAMTNLVQGSWPEYHDAWQRSIHGDSEARLISRHIDEEVSVAIRDRRAGLVAIATRFQSSPAQYASWYLSKPALLWGWEMRIAAAPLYVFPTTHSPLDSNSLARSVVRSTEVLNPWIALLALAGCCLPMAAKPGGSIALPALLLLYVTIVYGVLQSEPRYAMPFRGAEIVLATTGTARMVGMLISSFRRIRPWIGHRSVR